MRLVGRVIAVARQEFQVSQGALDPRDQQALRDHPAHKDLWAHEETKATMANQEAKAPQAPRDFKEPKVTWAIKEAKALLVPRDRQGHCEVTGNSACFKV